MKNPFKKKGITQTVVNTLIGGAGNVAADYVIANVEQLATVDPMYINGGKVLAGALIGSMSRNKYVHALADGMAVVGASALVSSLIDGQATPAASGLPYGTVGRVMAGDRYFKTGRKGNGFTVSSAFVRN